MEIFLPVVLFLLGLVLGFYITRKTVPTVIDLSGDLSKAREGLAALEGKFYASREEIEKLNKQLHEKDEKIIQYSSENASLKERNSSTEDKLKDLGEVKDKLTKEFENLAHKIFTEKMTHFQKDSTANLDTVLKPFKEKLGEFQTTVVKYREDEMKEASSLKTEIQNIFQLNQKLSTEAHNLTKALKGDKKTQGNWGELILDRVLQSSGLREGEEYVLQGKEMGLTNDEDRSLRPDVIINLPDGKHIIVDSKVTLNTYDRIINSEEDVDRVVALKEFTGAIRKHISGLSEKKYQNLEKLITPDFVLIFIPIEGAFSTALQNDPELFEYGWDRKIILVSPTTLMVTLRTIESIWKQEKQNKYALEIARQAGDLYDKFVGFVADLEDLRKSLDKSKICFDMMMGKLTTGRGNIISRFEKLKDLGAKANKSLEISYDE